MKCQFCGADLKEGAKFCEGCGAKVEENAAVNETAPVVDNQQPYYQPSKKNTGMKVTIIILSIIIVLLLAFGIWFFLIKGDDSSKNKENEIANNDGKGNNTGNNIIDNGGNTVDDNGGNTIDDNGGNSGGNTINDNGGGTNTSSGHTLSCSASAEKEKISVDIQFNDAETEPVKILMSMEMNIDFSEYGVGPESTDLIKQSIEQTTCDASKYDTCVVTVENNKVIVNITSTKEEALEEIVGDYDADEYSLDDVIAEARNSGYSCTRK